MRSIPNGAKGSFSLVVAPEHLANRFKDAMLPPVLATPVMIMMMENAALNAIKPYLDAGESAVGTRVDVVHRIPTPLAGASTHTRKSSRAKDGASNSGSRRKSGLSRSALARTSGWSSISRSSLNS